MDEKKTPSNLCKVRKVSEEVLYADQPIVEVSSADVRLLLEQSQLNERRSIRLCTHRTIDDSVHEMFIVHTNNTYVPPHKHMTKTEAYHVIEGLADVVLFDDEGRITQVVHMGDYSSGRVFYYRLSDPIYHTVLVRSEKVVFHEITNGPFRKGDSIFAPFAPLATDRKGQLEYINTLVSLVDKFD